jgi:hypothetical protein
MTPINFYVDPGCPWTFVTAQWILDIAPDRDIDITWQTFSLRHTNRNNPDLPPFITNALNAQQRGLRILHHTITSGDRDRATALYIELAERIHLHNDFHLTTLTHAIAVVGLPANTIEIAEDHTLDAAIITSTETGQTLVGPDVGIPIITIPNAKATFFGPVLSALPTHSDGLALWDAHTTLATIDTLYEIKRTRTMQQPTIKPTR